MNYLKTAILLAGLTALFMGVGYLIGGQGGGPWLDGRMRMARLRCVRHDGVSPASRRGRRGAGSTG